MPTYTVSQLNAHVRAQLESDYRDLWVEGEISNLSRPASGHHYFTLKDDAAQVACALFKGNTFGLKLPARELANGLAVRVHGRATLYEPRGSYQLILDQIEAAGIGALEAELKRRRELLAAEGCFDAARKRPIPPDPRRIGIITSASGAAIHDALTTLRRRNPLVGVILYPSLVQGELAPAQLISQIQTANRRAECDTLLLIRGGGSLEDLWAYNDPALIRAIAASRIPVISGVGHETDVTLADLAADLRAPTPTAAAAHSCPDLAGRVQTLAHLAERLRQAARRQQQQRQQHLHHLAHRLHQQSPQRQIRTAQQRADQLGERLHAAARRRCQGEQARLRVLMQRLYQQNPQRHIQRAQQHTGQLGERLHAATRRRCESEQARLHALMQQLHQLSPLNILQRGYALASNADGKTLTRSDAVQPGEKISVRLAVGRLHCTVNRRSKT